MEHAIGGAPETASAQRPGWWWTIGSLLLATILSIVVVAAVVIPLAALHVIPSDLGSPGAWPWPRTSVWAVAAGLGPLLLIGYGFAYATRLVVSSRSDWQVRLSPIALLFVLAAALPAGHTTSGGFWLLLLIVVRQWAITAEPIVTPRPSRPVWLAAGAVALLLTLATVSYQPLHPLSVSSSTVAFADGRPTRWLQFTLEVDGAAGTRIRSVSVPDDGHSIFSYVVKLDDPAVLGRRLERGATVAGLIEISPRFCRRGSATVRPETLLVRVGVLGRERTQRLALNADGAIRCPRRR